MLFAIKVGTSDSASVQIVEAETMGLALCVLEDHWRKYNLSVHGGTAISVAPASSVNLAGYLQ